MMKKTVCLHGWNDRWGRKKYYTSVIPPIFALCCDVAFADAGLESPEQGIPHLFFVLCQDKDTI